ncbi:response regulator transcription factor [Paraclostridium bifermentans]|uniref:response regulator transcription factor n=1 Tax=Paraclostridium bifermentans TaxID=1490 RepID=UPI0011DD95B1|nr:response regulator transcription factor [Paraclostridium bifermentans]
MYKVMLVDDERLILQGVLNIIDWEKLGMEVIHMAENGKEALDKYKENPVDIIITDINMPVITGLELIMKIKEINKRAKFIVLSGYDEFSYARTAMKYGVENYILKPINEEELEAALIDINKKIKDEKEEENIILEKNSIIMKLLNGNVDSNELYYLKDIIRLEFKNKYYTVSNILFNNKDIKNKIDVQNLIDVNTSDKYEIIYKFNGDIILINSWNTDVNDESINKYYDTILKKLSSEFDEVFIAVGDKVESIEDIPKSYADSNIIKKYILTEGYNSCLYKNDIVKITNKNRSFNKEIEYLNKIIIEKNEDKTLEYIEKIFKNEELAPEDIYDLSIKILLLIDKISEDFRLSKNYKDETLSSVIVSIYDASTIDRIKEIITNQVIELSKVMNTNIVKYTPIVQQVVNYIDERYFEEVSLKTLSQKYNINSSYLGQIFTKEVGYSFSEYLNKIKNMKAKELILNTNMKINDIAKEVGYYETSYFYRKFKEFYGVSPATLREFKNY